jgi:hypothetical protein
MTMWMTALLLAACSLLPAHLAVVQAGDDGPIVGAIRWDGWYGDPTVTAAVEASLGQRKYHFRLPWFAEVMGEDTVRINGDSQPIMDQEITYAAQAGLNYWAFLDYLEEAPGMSIALNRYLATKDKKGIRYCLIEEGTRLDKAGTSAWGRLVEHFRHPDYQTVLDGRPLLCVSGTTATLGKAEWADLKQRTIAAGLKAPYLVLMDWKNPEADRVRLGFDAVSRYAASGKGYTTDPLSYQPVEKVFRTFSTDENLRFSRTLRVHDRIPAIPQAVYPQPAMPRSRPTTCDGSCGTRGRRMTLPASRSPAPAGILVRDRNGRRRGAMI